MSTPDDDLLDRSLIREFQQMAGEEGQTLFDELRDLYLENVPPRLTQIREALTDPVKLAFHAHALKSMSLNMGARAVVELAQRMEALGRAGSVEGARELLEQLEVVFGRTQKELAAVAGQ